MLSFLRLSFLPASADFGLLLLRVIAGGSMLWLHGRDKLLNFEDKMAKFNNIVVSSKVSLGLTVFAEVLCAGLLVIGLFSRLAAFLLAVTMGVALYKVHGLKLIGPGSGELALLYFMGFAALFFTGPGKFSADGSFGNAGGGKAH
jgi:putative oxidoreductase